MYDLLFYAFLVLTTAIVVCLVWDEYKSSRQCAFLKSKPSPNTYYRVTERNMDHRVK